MIIYTPEKLSHHTVAAEVGMVRGPSAAGSLRSTLSRLSTLISSLFKTYHYLIVLLDINHDTGTVDAVDLTVASPRNRRDSRYSVQNVEIFCGA